MASATHWRQTGLVPLLQASVCATLQDPSGAERPLVVSPQLDRKRAQGCSTQSCDSKARSERIESLWRAFT